MRSRVLLPLVLATTAIVLAACGSSASEPTAQPATMADVDSLTFTSTAVTVDGKDKPLASEQPITIAFSGGRVSIKAGCNTMVGSAAIVDGVLNTGELASTMMACEPALMDQDAWLTRVLSAGPTVTRPDDHSITLTSGGTVIDLAVVETVGENDTPLGDENSQAQAQALCDDLIAKKATETDAQAAAEQAGMLFRVGTREGESFPMTMDFRPNRITVTIEGGVVTECTTG